MKLIDLLNKLDGFITVCIKHTSDKWLNYVSINCILSNKDKYENILYKNVEKIKIIDFITLHIYLGE